jgi:transcriptional regulator with XRE-family HTH domain
MTPAEVQEVLTVLSGNVARLRTLRGLSLRDLARETGVSNVTLSRIERGKTPDAPTLIRLARWLLIQAKSRRSA